MNTAQIILSQIKSLDPMALMAWGAKDLLNMGDGLKFRTSGMTPWKGYVYIRYNEATDLYDVRFMRFRKFDLVEDVTHNDIYFDSLVDVIDRKVG